MRRLSVAALAAAFVALAACTAEQTEEGEMPEVDVQAEPGQVPEYDVDPADVDVSTDTQTVTVPDVDVEPAQGNP